MIPENAAGPICDMIEFLEGGAALGICSVSRDRSEFIEDR